MNQHSKPDSHQTSDPKSLPPLPEGWKHAEEANSEQQRVYLSKAVGRPSLRLLRLIGYAFLSLALFDYLHLLIPLELMNPRWEFQTMGQLVERAAIPLLGFLFVFYRREGNVNKKELHLLRFLSWISLLLGLMYLLMLPLGVINTWRINNINNAQTSAQLSEQSQPIQELKEQLDVAKTDTEIRGLLKSMSPDNRPPAIENPQKVKSKLLTQLESNNQTLRTQAATARSNQKWALMKDSVKQNLGALIIGSLFILIWNLTSWVRLLFRFGT